MLSPDVPDVPELSNLHFHCMTKLNATHVFIGGIESMDYDVYDVSFLVKGVSLRFKMSWFSN